MHVTEARLLVIVTQADAEDFAHSILSGKKGDCLTRIHAKLSLDPENFPTVPAKATVQQWLETALAKRKAAVGVNAEKDYTGDGSEDEVCCVPLCSKQLACLHGMSFGRSCTAAYTFSLAGGHAAHRAQHSLV